MVTMTLTVKKIMRRWRRKAMTKKRTILILIQPMKRIDAIRVVTVIIWGKRTQT